MTAIAAEKVETLDTCLGNYPHTEALKSGRVRSDRVMLRFTDVEPITVTFTAP